MVTRRQTGGRRRTSRSRPPGSGKVRALILTGNGINCDRETQTAFEMSGAKAARVHIFDLIAGRDRLSRYHILALPGGFSYGDNLGAGIAMANKLRVGLMKEITAFIKSGRPIIGICNGAQILVKLGLLPALGRDYFLQTATLTFNASGRFEDRWVTLRIAEGTPCVFLRGMQGLTLPVRHGEGRFLAPRNVIRTMRAHGQAALLYSDERGRPTMRYPENPNGSLDSIAGLCDPSGRVFGLMPHPEAFLFFENHPRWTRIKEERLRRGLPPPQEGEGLQIFRNAVECARDTL